MTAKVVRALMLSNGPQKRVSRFIKKIIVIFRENVAQFMVFSLLCNINVYNGQIVHFLSTISI